MALSSLKYLGADWQNVQQNVCIVPLLTRLDNLAKSKYPMMTQSRAIAIKPKLHMSSSSPAIATFFLQHEVYMTEVKWHWSFLSHAYFSKSFMFIYHNPSFTIIVHIYSRVGFGRWICIITSNRRTVGVYIH